MSQGAEMTLIERLNQTNQFHDNADVSTQEVVTAIEALQAENERLIREVVNRNQRALDAAIDAAKGGQQ